MIEEAILNYLRENAFSCYMSMPEKPSGNFCILEKTGDSPDEGIYTATLAVQSYGSSDFSAARLSHFVYSRQCQSWSKGKAHSYGFT